MSDFKIGDRFRLRKGPGWIPSYQKHAELGTIFTITKIFNSGIAHFIPRIEGNTHGLSDVKLVNVEKVSRPIIIIYGTS